ncbi:ciliogenesis and planar polarity effector 1 isoform X2 [Vanacampus margaritifer]
MELKLDVVLSSRIKRKKPWPRFCWLGQEKECVFLFDDKRISEINMVSGRTKKKTPKLHPLLNNVITMAPSRNGMWLSGLLASGELFLWNRDHDLLRTVAAVPEIVHMIISLQGNSERLSVHVSDDGARVLLVTTLGQAFLWGCTDVEDLTSASDSSVKGRWVQIPPPQDAPLPTLKDKEASQCSLFVTTGDVCLSAFVFTSGKKLIITCLKIQWVDHHLLVGSLGYSIEWATKTYPMSRLTPPCQAVKSRGALVVDFSPDGQLLAVVLNQRHPKATQVLYVSTQNFVSVSSGLGRCGCKTEQIPSKYTRSYWVGSVSWSHDGLFLACVLKRGALLVLARLGGLLTLSSSGCNVDFGPAHFLPLHPLVTYRPPSGRAEAHLSSSSVSARDTMRQRYSVTWHPRLLYCIVSDGYMATVLRVLNRPSPAMLVKAMLDNTSKDLQKACQLLDTSQPYVRTCLESYLNLDAKSFTPSAPHPADSIISATTHESTLPFFLQDQGTFSGTKEMLERVQSFFEDDSDVEGPPPASHLADGGRLEFASMFDTLHALDTETDLTQDQEEDFEMTVCHLRQDLGKIQNGLLTAWALCMSLGAAVENRASLLKYAVLRTAQLAALFHLMPSDAAHSGKIGPCGSACILELLKALFSFLPWDNAHSDGPPGLGPAVELSERLVRLLLAPPPESHPSGRVDRLSGAVLILQLASDALDCAYSLQQRTCWSSAEKDTHPPASDVYHVPLLQDYGENQRDLAQGLPLPQRPSSRLSGVWQWVYKVSQHYKEDMQGLKEAGDWEESDEEQLSIIMSKIQAAVQATGEKLEEGPALLNHTGEQLFLCGLYQNSSETWRTQIWEESKKSSYRSPFQETRLCLALLYSLLSQYRLREAIELGEHVAHLALHNVGQHYNHTTCTTDPLLPTDLHSDAVIAVIQALARFMASYFTNQPLNILPAHHVAVLPPLHLPHAANVGRLVPLCQEAAARAVRQQNMSEKWTVDYSLDLLLLGGLLPETAWLAFKLGDWKTAAAVGLAYVYYCDSHLDLTRINKQELHLPKDLLPGSIFQAELQFLLENDTDEHIDVNDTRFTDPVEGQELDAMQGSAQEILKASVIAGVDVLTSQLTSLLESAKELCSGLSALVHSGLYLPSPPLYCPQPSPNTQDPVGTLGQLAEVATRHKVSGVLQRILLLLRSARCCHPAAQWYVSNLRRARHILHKIKTKYAYPSYPKEEKPLPEGLMKFVSRGGFFRRSHSKDLDPDSSQTIVCFRELCGLCWMLHVRDQLSIACRRFQAARTQQAPDISQVHSSCLDALLWAHRYLPFCQFLNTEEILQDLLLSLSAELPPLALVADTLVLAFPEKEASVRVSLREKYNSLMQSLRQCFEEGKEPSRKPMKALIQEKLRQRRKHLGRLLRHLAPLELRLWENEEDEGDQHRATTVRPRSPVASAGTLTADGEKAESASEGVSPEPRIPSICRKVKMKAKSTAAPTKSAREDVALPSLPVVGTWEFELDDDEYLTFLELFLSYMLEKDGSDRGEPPLLKSFCSDLRDRELHSLTFDVLTTMQRRQTDGGKHNGDELPVFRAGCCRGPAKHGTTPESQTPVAWNEACESRSNLSALSDLRTGKQMGLFSLRRQKGESGFDDNQSVLGEAIVELQQVLNSKLEGQFPVLGRLLEWMLRWADKRVLLGHTGKKKKKPKGEGTCQDGIVIRVKTSAPALLTSLSLLESRFMHLLQPGCSEEPRTVTAPVLQSEARTRSSVDTGCPRSANTPVAELDHDIEELSICSHTDELEELKSDRTPLPDEPDELDLSAPTANSTSQRPCFDDLDVTPEKEGTTSHTVGMSAVVNHRNRFFLTGKSSDDRTEQSSSFSNGMTSENFCSPQASLKLGELIETSSSSSIHGASHPVTRAPDGPVPQIPQAWLHTEPPHSRATLHPNTPFDHAGSQPCTSTAGAPAPDPFVPGQPSSFQALPMRQRLGEDLYRLVQNINYMSLVDVLGASFSNLQLAQQNSYLAQSNMNPSHNSAPSPYVTNVPPQPNPQPAHPPAVSQSQIHVPNPQSNNLPFAYQTPKPDHISNLAYASHDGRGIYQEFRPLSVQAESANIHFKESTRLIPSTEGLLITSNTNTIAPSAGNIHTDPSSQASGLKLLQLQSGRKIDKKRTPKRLLRFSHSTPTESHTRSSRRQNPASESKSHGLRLLHLQPGAQGHFNLPKLPSTPPPHHKHLFVPELTFGGTPKLQLLHIDIKPRTMSTPAPRSSQKARLISLEELAGLVAGRRNSEEARLQLLRVNDSAETHRGTTSSSGSSKRHKRRETERTNLANEPVVTTQELKVEPEEITPARDASIQSAVIPSPSGSNRSALAGRTLLDKSRATSAELHAFASTCKSPPECLDAFTNTEPKSFPMLVDKAVSVQASLLATTCTSKLKEQLYREKPSQDTDDITPFQEKRNLDQRGRNFLSVLDIEEGTQHHRDLPPAGSGTRDASSNPPAFTPAQLHMLATSANKSAHPAHEKTPKNGTQTDIYKNATKPNRELDRIYSEDLSDAEIRKAILSRRKERPRNSEPQGVYPEELPDSELIAATKTTRGDEPHRRVPEKVSPHYSEDSADSELSKATGTPRIDEPRNLASETATVWFSSHLSKLDSQLAALQDIADCLEKDLPSSRIPKEPRKPQEASPVSPVSPPNVKPAVRKTVRLSLPAEEPKTQPKHTHVSVRKNTLETRAPQPQPYATPEPDLCEEEEEEEEDADRKTSAPHRTPSAQIRHGQQSLPKHLSTVTLETFDETADESLDQTGLSDTAEILEGLVREGYISQADLDASLSNTLDSEQQEASRQISSRRAVPDEVDDRRELKMWMRCKQRERHSVYQKQRASLREREIKPFSRTPKSNGQVTSKRNTEEKQKSLLLKQFNQRLRDATLLADELRTSPFPGSRISVGDPPAVRSSSAPPTAGNRGKEKSLKRPSSQTHTQRHPWTAEAPGRPSGNTARPGTSLSREHPIGSARSHVDQRGVNLLLSDLTDEQGHGSGAGVTGMDWVDKLWESGGSLSEVDWAAIERMAEET